VDLSSRDEGRRPGQGLDDRAGDLQDLSRDTIPAIVPELTRRVSLLATLCLLISCGGPPPAAPPEPAPQRIVSLTPALTEILFALDLGDRVVGVTEYCDRPPEAKSRPKVGGYVNPSVEAVIALSPDLIVVSPGPGNRDAVQAMGRAGLRVAVVPAESLDETFAAIEKVADSAGRPERGRELVERLRARIDAVGRRVASRPRVRTLFSVQADPIIAAGRGTLPSQLLEAAGGLNVVDAGRYPKLGIESVVQLAPEVVLQSRMDMAGGDGSVERAAWTRWTAIPAIAKGRLVVLPDDAALRPGPRVADAVEQLAAILHPEAPPDRRE
jgi:iron complex transport system substrate-binding protein